MLGDAVNKETSFNTNWATHTTSAYIQCFCLYLNQQTAASNAWTFCVCTWRTHTHTTNTLSYSFSHSVELPLCFTGVVLHHLRETVTFTQNNLDTVRRTFQFIVQTQCLHITFWVFGVPELFFILLFICFSPRQRMYMTVYTIQTHAFRLSPKVWSTTFSKSFQYLKITALLHSSFHVCSLSTC